MTSEREAYLRESNEGSIFPDKTLRECLDAIARMREAMQRDGQIIEHLTLEVGTQVLTVERMRPVVEAAQSWRHYGYPNAEHLEAIVKAVDAYEEAENGRG